jgi:hypothetical protein
MVVFEILTGPIFPGIVLEKVHEKFMVVLAKFPKLSIIGLIHKKFHKFIYKMRETFHDHFFSNFIVLFTIVILKKWCSGKH